MGVSHSYHNSAKIEKNPYCKECHFPVVFVCCNGTMADFSLNKDGPWDWWLYCSNKGRKNHEGEGIFQNNVKWTYKDYGSS